MQFFVNHCRCPRAARLLRAFGLALIASLLEPAALEAQSAQSVLQPPPAGYGVPGPGAAAQLASSTNQSFALPSNLPSSPVADLPEAFRWGPVDFRPHFLYRFTYGDGLQSSPGHTQKSAINEFYPGALFTLGTHWALDYSPVFRFYSDPRFRNTIDQSLSLNGGAQYHHWSFNFGQTYSKSSEPLVETGAQTDQESYATSVGATTSLNSRLTLQLGLSQSVQHAAGFQNITSWTTSDWLDYHFNSQFSIGLGPTLGYDAVSGGSDERSESIQARIQWKPGQKLSLQVSGGIEDRQFLGGGIPESVSPILSASIGYQIFSKTGLGLSASRSVSPSLYTSQLTTSTSVGFSLSQQMGTKLSLTLNANYGNDSYQNLTLGPLPAFWIGPPPFKTLSVDRTDNTTSFTASLGWNFASRSSLNLFYSVSRNSTGQSNFQYSSSQMGFSVGYKF